MTRAPAWTEREFETLLANPSLSDMEMVSRLPQRTENAVGWVRSGIHSYHRGGDISMLSKLMVRRLENGPTVTCPRCSAEV